MSAAGLSRSILLLPVVFTGLTLVCFFTAGAPLAGLSTVISVSVLGSSVLGSSVLGSSVLGSSMLGTTILEAYTEAVSIAQFWLSLASIILLTYLEISDPRCYGRFKKDILEVRRSWLPAASLLALLFFIVVGFRVWAILAG